jgi:chemotaxis signal transduction protein
MQSILDDCAAGLAADDALVLLDPAGQVVRSHGALPQNTTALQQALRAQEPIVDVRNHLHALGHAQAPGYREFGREGAYQHGLHCVALRHLCARQTGSAVPGSAQTLHHGVSGQAAQPLQMATFSQGNYWLGLDATLIAMAAPDTKVLAASSVLPPFSGIAHIQNKVYPVVDLRSAVENQEPASPLADSARQLIVLQLPLENGTLAAFALRVDKLGPMLDLDRSQLQGINMAHNAAPSMIDAVVRFGTSNGQTPGVLCQLSKNWLQYCVGTLKGEFSAQDLSSLQVGAKATGK